MPRFEIPPVPRRPALPSWRIADAAADATAAQGAPPRDVGTSGAS
jgi:hypothetical protein